MELAESDKEWIREQIRYTVSEHYGNYMQAALDSFPQMPNDQCSLGKAFQKAVNRATELRTRAILEHLGIRARDIPSEVWEQEYGEELVTATGLPTVESTRAQLNGNGSHEAGRVQGWQEAVDVLTQTMPGLDVPVAVRD